MREIAVLNVKQVRGNSLSLMDQMFENGEGFQIRMAVPAIATGHMRISLAGNRMEARDAGGVVVRRMPLPERTDPRTVRAVLRDGFVQVTGTKLRHKEAPVFVRVRSMGAAA